MRIELALAGATVGGRVRAAWVDRQARNGSAPSDQPVVVDLDEAPDRDIGPVVPPRRIGHAAAGAVAATRPRNSSSVSATVADRPLVALSRRRRC